MEQAKGFAYCGLACCLCEEAGCQGCRAGGCPQGGRCAIRRCCREQGLAGCWECERFPCAQPLLQKPRVRAFVRFLRDRGAPALCARLATGEAAGMAYHHPGALTGDYDALGGEEAIYRYLRGL